VVKTREDYELESGLADDFDGVITDAYFEVNPNPEYVAKAGEEPGLALIIESPDLDQPVHQWYSCGAAKQWQIGRGGQEITSAVRPDSHRFNMNSKGGVLVSRMFEIIGNGDRGKGQDFFIKRDRYMTEGAFYIGLNFHWLNKPAKMMGTDMPVLSPVAYLGEVSPGKPSKATITGVPTEDLDTIVIELVSGKTEREVKMAAMKEDGLKANDAYMKELISGPKLKQLEDADKITRGPDGKYI